jgi:hypothetical protein
MNGSFTIRLFAENVVTLPRTERFPVIAISPEIVWLPLPISLTKVWSA